MTELQCKIYLSKKTNVHKKSPLVLIATNNKGAYKNPI